MNVFYLDHHTHRCAKQHVDKHVVKMIVEYAQLLSTAHRVLDGEEYEGRTANNRRIRRFKMANSNIENTLYKASHINHPSAIWVRESSQHYWWLYLLFRELCMEYTHRYGKIHSTESKLGEILQIKPKNIKDNGFVEPPQAMPDYCKVPGDSIKAYQMYYVNEKIGFAKWTKRDIPTWFVAEAYAGFGEPAGYAS
mgnify:FL=1